MKILVAYDGSVYGDGALYDLGRAGLPARSEALVVSVTLPFLPSVEGKGPAQEGWSAVATERAKANAQAALEESRVSADRAGRYLRSRFPKWKVKTEAFFASPARGILDRAEAWKPDLIVLGSHGRTAMGRALLGSVSQKVLLHAQSGIRIARARIGTGSNAPRILLGMDGSEEALAAAEVLASRTWPPGAEVRIVAVLDARDALEGVLEGTGNQEIRPTWIEKRLQAVGAKLARHGLKATTELLVGEPRAILIDESKLWAADCVFLGSRGLNSPERFLLGSVSSAVAAHASCSVEIVRSPKAGIPPEKSAASLGKKIAGSQKRKLKINGVKRSKRPRPAERPFNPA